MDAPDLIGRGDVHQIVAGITLKSEGTVGTQKGRLNYDAGFKQQLAKASCERSVLVARLALKHGKRKYGAQVAAAVSSGAGIAGAASVCAVLAVDVCAG